MKPLNTEQSAFLRELMRWGGIASATNLGPQTRQAENSARQTCKRRGYVTYDGGSNGYWRITDAGRAALALPSEDHR